MEYRLDKTEIECVKQVEDMVEKGECYVEADLNDDERDNALNVSPEKRAAILETMESMGLLAEVRHSDRLRYFAFKITSKAVQVAREIEEKQKDKNEPEDIVEQLKRTAKGNRAIAWALIIFVVLTALVTFINQLLELLKKIGIALG